MEKKTKEVLNSPKLTASIKSIALYMTYIKHLRSEIDVKAYIQFFTQKNIELCKKKYH